MENSIIKTVVDIGNGRIKALMAEIISNGETVNILAYEEGPSEGMIKSQIVDEEKLGSSIKQVLERISEKSEKKIKSITIGISGDKIKSTTVGTELVLDEERVITEEDVEELIKKAEAQVLAEGEVVLKTEIYNIKVDNSGIVKNPVDIKGSKFCGDVHLIYADSNIIKEMTEFIKKQLGLSVENVILNGYASAKSTLDDENKRMGVALIDIGEGTTDIIIFKNNKLIYLETLPLGGRHFKTDLCYLLKLSDENLATEILDKYRNKDYDEAGIISYGYDKTITKNDIENAIKARIDDIIDYIDATIQKSGFNGCLVKGMIITGGVVGDKMFTDEQFLGRVNSVTKGRFVAKRYLPIVYPNVIGFEKVDTSMATVIGLLYEILESEAKEERNDESLGIADNQNDNNEEEKYNSKEKDTKLSNTDGLEDVIKNEEKKENGLIKGIKDWFSNFI